MVTLYLDTSSVNDLGELICKLNIEVHFEREGSLLSLTGGLGDFPGCNRQILCPEKFR